MSDLFYRRKAGIDCPFCPDGEEADVVAELASGRVHLQNDADFPGYCILVFRRHAVELFDLTEAERIAWIEDIARIGTALQAVCSPDKLNVSMLGNLMPHLHCHIMPRYPTDPNWGGPVDLGRSALPQMPPEDYEALRSRLKQALAS